MTNNRKKIKKALITGATGFIGTALTTRLIDNNIEVVALSNVNADSEFPCKVVIADATAPQAIDNLVDENTTVFHLAAQTNVSASVQDPVSDLKTNFLGYLEILNTARKRGCQIIFPSSASLFEPNDTCCHKESDQTRPTSPYGASKLACEAYSYAYHRSYGIDVRIARLFSVYGIGMKKFAIHDMIRKLQKNPDQLTLLGDGQQIRDYLYIDDLVSGLILIAEQGLPGEDYNLGSGQPTRIIDLARQIKDLMGCSAAEIKCSGVFQPGEVKKWYADISKIKSLGFEPQISLESGLMKTIKWLMN